MKARIIPPTSAGPPELIGLFIDSWCDVAGGRRAPAMADAPRRSSLCMVVPRRRLAIGHIYGPVFFVALSYAGLHPTLNDPAKWHIERLARRVEEFRVFSFTGFLWFMKARIIPPTTTGPPEDIGLFFDFQAEREIAQRSVFPRRFSSGASCATYWQKMRGLMPGVAYPNGHASRYECLHIESARLRLLRVSWRSSGCSVSLGSFAL
jgi:hypothetical protein